ncbi:MAG: cardiolipin synthase [Phycisphaerales bacterium]|nr:cardiolipin synthase [Phycisphaerales bacterium]
MLILAEFVFRIGLVIMILSRRRIEPTTRLSWIILLLAIPVIGSIIYLLVGETRFGRQRIARHRRIIEALARPEVHANADPGTSAAGSLKSASLRIARLAELVSDSGPVLGNEIELFGDTNLILDGLEKDINAAREHCHLEFFIWLDDAAGVRIGEALIRAVARGLQSRVLVDGVGSKAFLRSALCRKMRAGGVEVVAALPANAVRALFSRIDLRNHRKIVVIDRGLAWTGSQNLAEASFAPKPKFAPWVDCAVRLQGPAAKELHLLFVEDWYLDTDESLIELLMTPVAMRPHGVPAQAFGTGPNFQNLAATQGLQSFIHEAKSQLVITTPYFVPDNATVVNLATAARRGVDVHLVVPRRNDSFLVGLASRSCYGTLLESGVHIHEFEGGLLHAKTITLDSDISLVSSANLDRRSLFLNFEAGLYVYDQDFTSQLRFLQQSYMDSSRQVDPVSWNKRGAKARLAENAAGLLSPLL